MLVYFLLRMIHEWRLPRLAGGLVFAVWLASYSLLIFANLFSSFHLHEGISCKWHVYCALECACQTKRGRHGTSFVLFFIPIGTHTHTHTLAYTNPRQWGKGLFCNQKVNFLVNQNNKIIFFIYLTSLHYFQSTTSLIWIYFRFKGI